MNIPLKILFLITLVSSQSTTPGYDTDRDCGEDLSNLWLDVVCVVDNSVGMTQEGLVQVAAQISTVFGQGTRIGTQGYQDPRTTRVGLVTYNEEANVVADLNRFQSADDLMNTIFTILPVPTDIDQTFLAKGIGAAEKVLTSGRSNGTRSNYRQIIIVYASEYKDTGDNDARPTAERLKASGVSIVTVGFDQDGDEFLLKALGEIATPGYNFTNKDGDLIKEIQTAMIQTNCFCPNLWTQFRSDYSIEQSPKLGICVKPVGLTASWAAAKYACQNLAKMGYMVTEFDKRKHDFVFQLVRNSSIFTEPYTYHIGLSYVNGAYYWQQPAGHSLKPLQDNFWNTGYPQLTTQTTAVFNQQDNSITSVGWQNINQYTVSERYVCEVASCDTDTYCDFM